MLHWELAIKTLGLYSFSTIAPFIWKKQEMQEFKSVGWCPFGLLVTLQHFISDKNNPQWSGDLQEPERQRNQADTTMDLENFPYNLGHKM